MDCKLDTSDVHCGTLMPSTPKVLLNSRRICYVSYCDSCSHHMTLKKPAPSCAPESLLDYLLVRRCFPCSGWNLLKSGAWHQSSCELINGAGIGETGQHSSGNDILLSLKMSFEYYTCVRRPSSHQWICWNNAALQLLDETIQARISFS